MPATFFRRLPLVVDADEVVLLVRGSSSRDVVAIAAGKCAWVPRCSDSGQGREGARMQLRRGQQGKIQGVFTRAKVWSASGATGCAGRRDMEANGGTTT